MKALVILVIVGAVVLSGLGGFLVGYVLLKPPSPPVVNEFTQDVKLSGTGFSCGPSSQPPYLQGALQFNLTSTYWTDVVASVAYTGDWTGDTNQLVHTNSTKHVAVSWGPGMMQSIQVTQCPHVGVTIWLIQQDLMACPNPPCDAGLTPAP